MCKANRNKAGGGMLDRMRHLQGQTPGSGANGADERGEASALQPPSPPPPLPPILRLLSGDVMTEACTLLDARSLATAAAVCRSFRDVCHGSYPWKCLCSREWGLPNFDDEDGRRRLEGRARESAVAAAVPRGRLRFLDSILGCDFRKLFPLIEQMPSGFDCSLLRDTSSSNGVNDANNNGDGDGAADGDDNHNQQAEEEAAAAPEGQEAEAGAGGPGDVARDAILHVAASGAAAAATTAATAEAEPEETEEEAGDFLVKVLKRRPLRKLASAASPGSAAAAIAGQRAAAEAAAASEGWPRSSSGDVALQVEFRGIVGVGNRCVRADLPLPSTLPRERIGAGARSSLVSHLETSPLALFRWLLAKMAATASGSSGAGTGRWSNAERSSSSSAAAHLNLFQNHHAQPHVGLDGQEEVEQQAPGASDDDELGLRQGRWGQGAEGFGAKGEGRKRASSLPNEGLGGGSGWHHYKPNLPRVFCFPVALGRDVFDVTPRLVSYFEVTILTPRFDPPHAIPECIAVGVSEHHFPLKDKMPGWDACSYGYHSDDGGAFHDAGSMLFKCGPSFGPGDVVGCGLDYSVGDDSADIFFTLNGESLNGGAAAFRGVRGTFYPTVGVDSACPVRINLGGQPFRFDLAAALRRGGEEAVARESVAQHEPKLNRSRAFTGTAVPVAEADGVHFGGGGAAAGAGGDPASPFSKGAADPSSFMRQSRQRSLAMSAMFPLAGTSARSDTSPNVALSY